MYVHLTLLFLIPSLLFFRVVCCYCFYLFSLMRRDEDKDNDNETLTFSCHKIKNHQITLMNSKKRGKKKIIKISFISQFNSIFLFLVPSTIFLLFPSFSFFPLSCYIRSISSCLAPSFRFLSVSSGSEFTFLLLSPLLLPPSFPPSSLPLFAILR